MRKKQLLAVLLTVSMTNPGSVVALAAPAAQTVESSNPSEGGGN